MRSKKKLVNIDDSDNNNSDNNNIDNNNNNNNNNNMATAMQTNNPYSTDKSEAAMIVTHLTVL